MIDIPSLERRWIKYKIKRLAPYALATLIISGGLIIFLYSMNRDDVTPPPLQPEIPLVKVTPTQIIPIEPSIPIVEQPIAVVTPIITPITVARPALVEAAVA